MNISSPTRHGRFVKLGTHKQTALQLMKCCFMFSVVKRKFIQSLFKEFSERVFMILTYLSMNFIYLYL